MLNTAASDRKIYLDYAAAAPLDSRVFAKMLPFFSAEYGNPSSLHESGRRSAAAIARARADVAAILGAEIDEIIFTGSGSEADNLAILGVARAYRSKGNHVIVSAIEHKAVLESARLLQKDGFNVTILPVDERGRVNVGALLKLVTTQTVLVSVMYANNEIGTIEPVAEIAAALAERRGDGFFPLFHTDACQAAGYLPIRVDELGVDLMTLNGSKIGGPRGIGVLYRRRGIALEPVIAGGEQEFGIRAGTESVPLIVGFAEALKLADAGRDENAERVGRLRDHFLARLLLEIPGAVLNGDGVERLPNNIHISVSGVEGESMLLMLDAKSIEVSTGSACSARDLKPSHVLLAVGQDTEIIHGSIRFSLGRATTRADIDRVMEVFPDIVRKLTSMSALTKKHESH